MALFPQSLAFSTEPQRFRMAQHSYDTQMAGDLYQRVAPAPNGGTTAVTTTYTHDALHRVTVVAYSDGTTPWTTLAYDQSSNWTSNISNGKGQLTGAFVCPSGTSGPTCGTTNPPSIGSIMINSENIDTNPADFGCLGGRCGVFNSMDFSHPGTTFHVDMANVYFFPVGTVIHTVGDLWGGHSWWRTGVPPFPFQ